MPVMMKSSVVAVLLCASLLLAQGNDEFVVNSLHFGVSNGKGWFKCTWDEGQGVEYDSLDRFEGIFDEEHHTSSSYVKNAKDALVTMSIHNNDMVSVTVIRSDAVVTIQPHMLKSYEPGRERSLSEGTHVVTIRRETTNTNWCGATSLKDRSGSKRPSPPSTMSMKEVEAIDISSARDSRQTMAVTKEKPRWLQTATPWTNCFSGQSIPQYLDIGIVIDRSFFAAYHFETNRTMYAVEAMLAATNVVYYFQFNIAIRLRQIYFHPAATGTEATVGNVLGQERDYSGDQTCPFPIDDTLLAMGIQSFFLPVGSTSSLIIDDPGDLRQWSHWHVLTDCFASGTIGVAYVDTICYLVTQTSGGVNSLANVGVSSRNFADEVWLTFAHEVGHAFGADHSFEEGEGTTGGIMDYGDGRYEGIYQFNEKYRRSEICTAIDFFVDFNLCVNNGETLGEIATLFDWLPGFTISNCAVEGSSCLNGLGKCTDGECVVQELKLIAIDDDSNTTFNFEFDLGEFGFPVAPSGPSYEAEFIVADPEDGCVASLANPSNYAGKIIVMRRGGGCTFYAKTQVAEAAGGIALVVVSDDALLVMGSPALPYTSVGIPSIMITKTNGDALIALIESSATGVDGIIGYTEAGVSTNFPDNTAAPFDYTPIIIAGVVFALIAVAAVLIFYARRRQENVVTAKFYN